MTSPRDYVLRRRSVLTGAAAALVAGAAVVLPGRTTRPETDGGTRVVTTTGILADLAGRVAGRDAHVVSLVPEGGDPHTFEPTPRDVREIAYADLALSNYLMLEEQSLIRTIDANIRSGVEHVALAEEASTRGAEIIPLVVDTSLDTIWLGLRVQGATTAASRLKQVRFTMTSMDGPGHLFAYVTGTFGQPEQVFNSAEGGGARSDIIDLPMDAHTHLSWAFTQPGIYRMGVAASWGGDRLAGGALATTELVLAVGVPGTEISERRDARILDAGHADITADIATDRIVMRVDAPGGAEEIPTEDVVVQVPTKALLPVPSDPAFRFIERPGTDVYQLPQAVLGKHVHGEIDPHLWQDVTNAQAYVEVIRDRLVQLDPAHAAGYRQRAAGYLRELDEVDEYVQTSLSSIPEGRRNLVTTHDAYGYLAHRYGLTIAGTVSPSPGQEPSIADRRRLARTITDLRVPTVFVEPVGGTQTKSLLDAAELAGVSVRPIWGDAFTPGVSTYADMMRANADSITRGLGGVPLGHHDDPGEQVSPGSQRGWL